jgi:phospholipase C
MRITAVGVAFLFLAGCGSSSTEDNGGHDASAPSDASIDGSSDGATGPSDASDGGSATCPSAPYDDSLRSRRTSCSFEAGARASATLGLTDAGRAAIPITHIVVVMKENRSFDHYFGQLSKNGQPDVEPQPSTFTNPPASGTGAAVAPFHLTTTCVSSDPDHQWAAMHEQVADGGMSGFVKSAGSSTGTDGTFVMGYYEPTDLPFYYFLANTYAIADHHFPSVRSGTFPNRDYLVLATSDGVTCTGCGFPDAAIPTIFDELEAAHLTWATYSDGEPLGGTLNWPNSHANNHSFSQFVSDAAAGTLPNVAFIDSIDNVQDEHPIADIQVGEAWTRTLYEALVSSPTWMSTAMILTYDEAGGFADHVPPGDSCIARPQDSAFSELGVRVPLMMISPWARRHFVSHAEHEHTSITRFIEAVYDLPALTARDANSDALLDMLDFGCPPAAPPDAPAAGTGGCP